MKLAEARKLTFTSVLSSAKVQAFDRRVRNACVQGYTAVRNIPAQYHLGFWVISFSYFIYTNKGVWSGSLLSKEGVTKTHIVNRSFRRSSAFVHFLCKVSIVNGYSSLGKAIFVWYACLLSFRRNE